MFCGLPPPQVGADPWTGIDHREGVHEEMQNGLNAIGSICRNQLQDQTPYAFGHSPCEPLTDVLCNSRVWKALEHNLDICKELVHLEAWHQ